MIFKNEQDIIEFCKKNSCKVIAAPREDGSTWIGVPLKYFSNIFEKS